MRAVGFGIETKRPFPVFVNFQILDYAKKFHYFIASANRQHLIKHLNFGHQHTYSYKTFGSLMQRSLMMKLSFIFL